jgi:hypothetical protein
MTLAALAKAERLVGVRSGARGGQQYGSIGRIDFTYSQLRVRYLDAGNVQQHRRRSRADYKTGAE